MVRKIEKREVREKVRKVVEVEEVCEVLCEVGVVYFGEECKGEL